MSTDGREPGSPVPETSVGESVFAAIWLAAFIVGRKLLTPWLDTIDPQALYGFDLFYSVLSIHFFGEGRFGLRFPATRLNFAIIALSVILGCMTYQTAEMRDIHIPFNLEDPRTLFALLIIGPVLEEILFHRAIWFSLETIAARWGGARRWLPWIVSSLLFSLGHFEAYFGIPDAYKPFVIYQTAYALAIALWWGRVILATDSVGLTMALHFGFNFGFFVGSLV